LNFQNEKEAPKYNSQKKEFQLSNCNNLISKKDFSFKTGYFYNENLSEYLIIGDIHANFETIENLLKIMKKNSKIKKIIFLGDIIEKGSQSVNTLFKVKDIIENPKNYGIEKAYLIIGNHEKRFLENSYKTCIENDKSNVWYEKSKENENMEMINYFSKSTNHKKLFEIVNFLKNQYMYIFINNKFLFSHAFVLPHIEIYKKNNHLKIQIKNVKYFFREREVDKAKNIFNIINVFGHINKGIVKEKNFISIDTSSMKKRKLTSFYNKTTKKNLFFAY